MSLIISNLIDVLRFLGVKQISKYQRHPTHPVYLLNADELADGNMFMHSILMCIDVYYRTLAPAKRREYMDDLKLYIANNIELIDHYITKVYTKDKRFKKIDIKNDFLNRAPIDSNIVLRHAVVEFFKINVLVLDPKGSSPVDYYLSHDGAEQTLKKCTIVLMDGYKPLFKSVNEYEDAIFRGPGELAFLYGREDIRYRNFDYTNEYLLGMLPEGSATATALANASRDEIIAAIKTRPSVYNFVRRRLT